MAVSDAIKIYVAVDAQVEYTFKEADFHNWVVRSKFDLIVQDARSLVLFDFDQPTPAA